MKGPRMWNLGPDVPQTGELPEVSFALVPVGPVPFGTVRVGHRASPPHELPPGSRGLHVAGGLYD